MTEKLLTGTLSLNTTNLFYPSPYSHYPSSPLLPSHPSSQLRTPPLHSPSLSYPTLLYPILPFPPLPYHTPSLPYHTLSPSLSSTPLPSPRLPSPPYSSLGAAARSEASSLGMQAAPSSIPMSGTFFHGDLVMKVFLRPFSLFR